MDKTDRRQFFADWLRAYADHLHLVRQGPRLDLVTPEATKPVVPATRMADSSISISKRKSTS